MTDKPPGPLEVRPNTLRDQTAPNTFRQKVMPGAVGRRDFNRGGGNAAPPRRIAGPQLPPWVFVAVGVVAVFVVLYLLNGTP